MADYYVLFFPLCKINLQLLLFRPLVNLHILQSITGVDESFHYFRPSHLFLEENITHVRNVPHNPPKKLIPFLFSSIFSCCC